MIITIFILVILIIAGLILDMMMKDEKASVQIFPYKRKNLLTESEYNFYWKLREYADSRHMNVFAQVRLADILDVTVKGKAWQTYFNKIQSKHIDFLLCNSRLHIVAVIELDDSSHNRPDRRTRDMFLDKACQSAGIPIIHIKESYTNLAEQMNAVLMQQRGE